MLNIGDYLFNFKSTISLILWTTVMCSKTNTKKTNQINTAKQRQWDKYIFFCSDFLIKTK